jgi:uncharacterized protein (TIGR00369 family)
VKRNEHDRRQRPHATAQVDRIWKKTGNTRVAGLRFHRSGSGQSGFSGIPGDHAYNPIGTVHGGYAATLLDSACGCSVHSCLTATQAYTTLELKVSYHKAVTRDSGVLRAEGRVLSIGRRAAFADATLKDASGRLLASATSTLLVMER